MYWNVSVCHGSVIMYESISRILKGEKVGKTKVKVGAGYEASTCFMARDVTQKHQLRIHLPLERYEPAQSLM